MKEKNRSVIFLKIVRIAYLILTGLVVAAGLSVYFFLDVYISKVNIVSPDQEAEAAPYVETGEAAELPEEDRPVQEELQDKNSAYASSYNGAFIPYSYYSTYIYPYLNAGSSDGEDSADIVLEQNDINVLKEKIKENYEAGDSIDIGGQENILIIGCGNGNLELNDDSTAMALLSINDEKKAVTVTSFVQDIYLQIPGEGNHRLGEAYVLGGAELLADTLEKNFKLEVDRYIQVDVFILIDIIDAIGGISLEVTKNDLDEVNTYIRELNAALGEDTDTDLIKKSENRHLNGKQALAYSWNSNLQLADPQLSGRQDKVMKAIHNQVNSYDLTKLHSLFDVILPKVTTNLSESEMIALLLYVPSYTDYKIRKVNIPVEGSYQNMLIDKKVVLGIDFKENIQELKNRLGN